MTKIYKNNIQGSPIKYVGIVDNQISLHGSKNILLMNSKSQINNLFGYIHRILKTEAVSPEIKGHIQNYFTQRNETLQDLGNERYLRMKKIIEAKALKAKAAGKKLLVVMGEEHHLPDPHFFQVAALDICKTNGIQNVLVELPESTPLLSSGKNIVIHNYLSKQLFFNVVSSLCSAKPISLHPIDSLHDEYGERTVSPQTRDQEINQSILKVDADALCVVGGAHIHHIKTDPALLAKYELAIFHSANLAYEKQYQNLTPTARNELLKNKELLILNTEQEIKNALSKANLSAPDLKFGRYEDLTLGKMYLMKSMSSEEITNLSLEDDTAKAIPSDTEALDIAVNVIKQNNPQSVILTKLQTLNNNYKKLQEVQEKVQEIQEKQGYFDNILIKVDLDYLRGNITYEKYLEEKSSDWMFQNQSINMYFNFFPQEDYDQESSEESEGSDEFDDAQNEPPLSIESYSNSPTLPDYNLHFVKVLGEDVKYNANWTISNDYPKE